MRRGYSGLGPIKCIIAGGVGILVSYGVYWRLRGYASSKANQTSSEQNSPNYKQHNQQEHQSQEDETKESQDAWLDLRATRAVPVEVRPSELPAGWQVLPVVFQPPTMAVLPFVAPAGGDCFIVCEGPLPRVEEGASFYLRYLQNHTLLSSVAANDVSVVPLENMGLSHESGCFTHIIVHQAEDVGIVFGRNGPYVFSLVITEFKLIFGDKEKNNTSECNLKLLDLQILLDACRLVPLVDGFRFPGTPLGVREGCLRVTCSNSNYIAVFAVPTTISVKSIVNAGGKNHKNDASLFELEGDVLQEGKIIVTAAALDSLVRGDTIDMLFPSKAPESSPVSSFLSLVSVQVLVGRAAKEETNGNENDTTSSTTVVLFSNNKEEKAEEDRVNVAFSHSRLGVSFSVNPRSSIVREPVLTDDLLVFYYPLGDGETPTSGEPTTESVGAPVCAVIRRLSQTPPSWEKYYATDEELKHNVLFHFTDWVKERVASSICELNGIRCVQFNEEKEGRSCRSYVIPLAHGIVVVRWETKSSEWEMHLPHLQQFLDTLHLVDTTG